MKDNNLILSLQETEELCRLYLECRLSALEEKELQYVLGRMEAYGSPVIDEARESMVAEGLLDIRKSGAVTTRPKRWFRWPGLVAGIAASAAVAVVLSVAVRDNVPKSGGDDGLIMAATAQETVSIAYEGGRRLSPEDADKAIRESMKMADELLALAEARDREEMEKIERLMQMTDKKP